jgi:hypothetical protein
VGLKNNYKIFIKIIWWYQNDTYICDTKMVLYMNNKKQKAFNWRPADEVFEAAQDMAGKRNLSINQYVTMAVSSQAAMDILMFSNKRKQSKKN